jgi:hypothetical protein
LLIEEIINQEKSVMKLFLSLLLGTMMMVVAAPAYAAQAVQMFACEVDDELTESQLEEQASKWLAAAKSVKGGENLKAFLHHPVAAKMDKGDMVFVIVAPSIAEWGMFWDNFKNSAPDNLDKANTGVACPDSFLFEAVEVK